MPRCLCKGGCATRSSLGSEAHIRKACEEGLECDLGFHPDELEAETRMRVSSEDRAAGREPRLCHLNGRYVAQALFDTERHQHRAASKPDRSATDETDPHAIGVAQRGYQSVRHTAEGGRKHLNGQRPRRRIFSVTGKWFAGNRRKYAVTCFESH